MNDEVWVDFLEGEVERDFRIDLEKLLNNSESDRARLEGLRWAKDLARSGLHMETEVADLSAQIMEKIEKQSESRDRLWRSQLGCGALVVGLVGLLAIHFVRLHYDMKRISEIVREKQAQRIFAAFFISNMGSGESSSLLQNWTNFSKSPCRAANARSKSPRSCI